MKYAEVLITQKIGNDFDTLTYSIPEELKVKIGQSVKISLRNRHQIGIVINIHENKPSFKTLPIKEILEEKPLLNESQLEILEWMSKNYFCPKFKILKLLVPKRNLARKPFRKTKDKPVEQKTKSKKKTLTKTQEETVKTILKKGSSNKFLIHGITGSGKTEIYTHLAKNYIDQGRQVLMLVPEISLTPQIIEYFEDTLNIKATIIHSKLSEGERYKAWEDIWENKAKLIIGSRSSIFAPFQDLGLIIIDEEHENSYKQDNAPRYKTHQIAEKIQELGSNTKIVLGSATPSVEAAEACKKTTLILNERIGNSTLPEVEIVDLRDEFKKKNYSIFSDKLKSEINKILEKKEQAILFLNRRGTASSIVCRDCGYIEKCKSCDVSLTYHSRTLGRPSLICHHCGLISTPPETCPECKGPNIRFLGIGTQKIEENLLAEFPGIKVLRADRDTTSTKHGFEKIYKAFRNHEADVLVGTQMIAKGLHLPKVNLVGIILADIGINIPDFRTAENAYQLITQVSGRAGRSDKQGKVIIQTYNPEHTSLNFAKNHDYENFFKYEITQRKLLKNPPFSKLAKLLISADSLSETKSKIEKIENYLWKIAREENITDKIEINSYPAYLVRLNNKHRYIILIKDLTNSEIIHNLLKKLPKDYIMDLNLKIDIDPIATT